MSTSSSSSSSIRTAPALSRAIAAENLFHFFCGSKEPKTQETQMHALAVFLHHTVTKAFKAFSRARYTVFDSNPGDGGCQMRGYLVMRLVHDQKLQKELATLADQTRTAHDRLNKRFSDVANGRKIEGSAENAFLSAFSPLALSQQAAFLLQCFVLKTLRIYNTTREDGIVMTKTDSSRLSILSARIVSFPSEQRDGFVGNCQAFHSETSIQLIQEKASTIRSMEPSEKEHLCAQLQSVRRVAIDGYAPKAFGFLFYEMKAILALCSEEDAIIGFRLFSSECIETLFFKKNEMNAYVSMSSKDMRGLDGKLPLFVIDGIHKEESPFTDLVTRFSLAPLMLGCAAQEAPFEPRSTMEAVTDDKAKRELMSYQKLNALTFFQPDHIFCAARDEIIR